MAKLLGCAGAPDQATGGDKFLPPHLSGPAYRAESGDLSVNAGELTVSA